MVGCRQVGWRWLKVGDRLSGIDATYIIENAHGNGLRASGTDKHGDKRTIWFTANEESFDAFCERFGIKFGDEKPAEVVPPRQFGEFMVGGTPTTMADWMQQVAVTAIHGSALPTEGSDFDMVLPHGGEVRITDPNTGGQKGSKQCQIGAVDPLALQAIGSVAGFGSEKYARYNFARGYAWSLSFDAMQRHLLAFWSGEETDPESGKPHLAHAAWHCMTLMTFSMRNRGTDDRMHRYLEELDQ